jgi:hypothetical protein
MVGWMDGRDIKWIRVNALRGVCRCSLPDPSSIFALLFTTNTQTNTRTHTHTHTHTHKQIDYKKTALRDSVELMERTLLEPMALALKRRLRAERESE